jgi:transcriptional regulator with XRE-family HTH domain
MKGYDLRLARKRAGYTQNRAAEKLGVSQPYLSLLERGERRAPERLLRRVLSAYNSAATHFPLKADPRTVSPTDSATLARDLGALGYSGFAYLRGGRRKNPAETLLSALSTRDLETRVTEGLPWLLLTYPDLDWKWLVSGAKEKGVQNRLGFLTNFARRVAERNGESNKAELLRKYEARLEPFRLFEEQTLCHDSMTKSEKLWLEENRPVEAKHWRVLTDLSPEHVRYG